MAATKSELPLKWNELTIVDLEPRPSSTTYFPIFHFNSEWLENIKKFFHIKTLRPHDEKLLFEKEYNWRDVFLCNIKLYYRLMLKLHFRLLADFAGITQHIVYYTINTTMWELILRRKLCVYTYFLEFGRFLISSLNDVWCVSIDFCILSNREIGVMHCILVFSSAHLLCFLCRM